MLERKLSPKLRRIFAKESTFPVAQMPHSAASFQKDVDTYKQKVERSVGEDFVYKAKLPEIVGVVPEGPEREFLLTFMPRAKHIETETQLIGVSSLDDNADGQLIREGMPNVVTTIEKDLHAIQPDASLMSCSFDRSYAKEGQSQRTPLWHSDGSTFVKYVISDTYPTECFNGNVYVSGRSFSPQKGKVVAAPEFAIVRLSPMTPHRSQNVLESTRKTFVDFTALINPK